MPENFGLSAMRVRQALDSGGRLNLWQVQAILGRSREYSLGVLSRLSRHSDIDLRWENGGILVTLNPLHSTRASVGRRSPEGTRAPLGEVQSAELPGFRPR